MTTDDPLQDPEEIERAERLLDEYLRNGGGYEGQPFYSVVCDLVTELLALCVRDSVELPEPYGDSTAERVGALAARCMWNLLEVNRRRFDQALRAPVTDAPTAADIDVALAAAETYLRNGETI